MWEPEYLKFMPKFKEAIEKLPIPIVDKSMDLFEPIIKQWAEFIHRQFTKGLTPLFITGSGISNGTGVPDIIGIIEKLRKESSDEGGNFKKEIPQDVKSLFDILEELKKRNEKDRSMVARLLSVFQKRSEIEDHWKRMNNWLLREILNANPTPFHEGLADLYEQFGAVCLTLNFDGLLIRELVKKRNKKAFSLPRKEECEKFFSRLYPKRKNTEEYVKEFIEVQVRGDILYLECKRKGYCPQKEKPPQSLWTTLTLQSVLEEKDIIKCPSCGEDRIPYLSFPGSYEKEKEIREILEVVWKYLAFRVGSVTVVGMSGVWDPLIVAFLGDLLSEREIPLLVVDTNPDSEKTSIVRELVIPKIHPALALKIDADTFMDNLLKKLKELPAHEYINMGFNSAPTFNDHFWHDKAENDEDIKKYINERVSEIELKLERSSQFQILKKSAQLGLKSIWLGIDPTRGEGKYHDRYHHSLGVMKVASYIYDKVIENSALELNFKEKQFLRIAALLHDIGHLPFSHLIEEVFNELNWRPTGYVTSFSHVLHTEEKIKQIFRDNSMAREIEKLGYEISDLVRLINGNFGIGYLDAIINSPIDADKISYVFSDTESTKREVALSPIQFLKDIVNGLTITPEKLLAFSGVSARVAGELLYARRHLYQNLYLQPGIRVLEGIVKQILITYFVHTLRLDDAEIWDKIGNSQDLGHYKILYCIKKVEGLIERSSNNEEVEKLMNNYLKNGAKELKKYEKNLEMRVLILMYDELTKLLLNRHLKESLKNGFKKIMKTIGEDAIKKLESEIISFLRFDKDDYYDKRVKVSKTCKLRMPGALIIEVVKTRKFLSISDERRKRERSDDTETFSECILVPSGEYETWYPTQDAQQPLLLSFFKDQEKKGFNIYIYPFSGDKSYVYSAGNLFNKLMDQQEIVSLEIE